MLMEELQALQHVANSWGMFAPLFLCGLLLLQAFMLPVPASLLTMLSVGFWGLETGVLVSWGCSTAGAIGAFWLARTIGRPAMTRFLPTKMLKNTESFFNRHGRSSIFWARALPFIPFGLVSYVVGVSNVSFCTYFFSTALGKIFPTLLYASLGNFLLSLPRTALSVVSALICFFVLMCMFHCRLHRKRPAYCEE